jgi:hypothetical protein
VIRLSVTRRSGDDALRRRRGQAGSSPSWPRIVANGVVSYHVYANTGIGDPINYSSPVATLSGTLTWTSAPLAYPGTWKFGVRAFWPMSGLEEQNVDAVAKIVLTSNGIDVTNQPLPPTGLRVLAMAGGALRVEWCYASNTTPSRLPTGFHVYSLLPGGTLSPTIQTRRPSGRPKGRAGPTLACARTLPNGGCSPGTRPDGSQRWSPAIGGGYVYPTPVATVSYSSGRFGTFACNLPGLINGQSYVIAVRAFNSIAEETNTNTVTVTADAVGPSAVSSLTATAT